MSFKKSVVILWPLIVSPIFAFAQTPATITINPNIPGMYNISTAGPCGWIVDFYNFALIIAGILAFGAIVYGGVLSATSAGNASKLSEGRSWIWSALIGLLLLGGAYIILYTVNPNLVKCSLPTLSGMAVNTVGGGGTTPPQGPPSSACTAPNTGPCTVANLQQTCLSSNAQVFAGICGHESGGIATVKSGTDYCTDSSGNKYPVSIGLFQVNLTNSWKGTVDGKNCGSAFQGQAIHCSGQGPCTTSDHRTPCQVVDPTLYRDCVSAAQDANNNINVACQLSSNGSQLGPWKADSKACGS